MMARAAEETASILINLYDESYVGESFKPFRIGWPELRSLAGVARLSDEYLWEIDQTLKESGYFLFPLDNFLLVALESDLSHIRAVPPRIVEECLPGDDDDLDLLGFDDDDDEFAEEDLEALFGDASDIEEPEPPGVRKEAEVKSTKGRKGKSSERAEQMSE